MSNELNIKNGIIVAGNSTVSGNQVITGSMTILGATNFTASQAASASYVTASKVDADQANLKSIQLDVVNGTLNNYNPGELSWDTRSQTISVGMLNGVTLQV